MLISRCDGMRMIKDGLVLHRMSATIREGPIAMRTGPRSRVDGSGLHRARGCSGTRTRQQEAYSGGPVEL